MSTARTRETHALVAMLVALSGAIAIEHFFIHRGVIEPALLSSPDLPPWMWAALYVPELIVCFGAGWRMRTWGEIAVAAAAGTAHRIAWTGALAWAGEPGHAVAPRAVGLLAQAAVVAVAYGAMFSLASWTAHEPGFVPAAPSSGPGA